MEVTPSFFRVLRTKAARGRLFGEDDGQVGRNHVVLLAHDFAARMPGGLDGIVGRQLRLNDEVYTVVGVVPRDFLFLNPEVRLWTPLAFTPEQRAENNRWSQNHQAIGRLAPGATVEQAQARMDALNTRLLERAGSLRSALEGAGYLTRVVPLKDDLVRNVQREPAAALGRRALRAPHCGRQPHEPRPRPRPTGACASSRRATRSAPAGRGSSGSS